MISLIASKKQATTRPSMSARSGDTETRPGHDTYSISESLSAIAMKVVDMKATGYDISLMSKILLKQIFHLSLQVDTIRRCGDISRLPFTYSTPK